MLLPGVGADGQERLRRASVLVVGMGGLGCPLALYLAAAGVGSLVLVDADRVQVSNLHRQVLYGSADVGRLKVEVAAERLRTLHPAVEIIPRAERLTARNAQSLVRASDVVADGSDNFATRYLVSDACVLENRPCAHGAVLRFEGHLTVLRHAGGPCYRCLYPAPPPAAVMPACNEGGVLGSVVGTIATLQATEVLKLLLGVGDVLVGRLFVLDALGGTARTVGFERNARCPVCGDAPTIHDLTADITPETCNSWSLTPSAAQAWLASGDSPLLLDVRSLPEHEMFHLGGRAVPLDDLVAASPSFDRDRPLLLYCQSGQRSAEGAARLRSMGFAAYTLSGGIEGWRDV